MRKIPEDMREGELHITPYGTLKITKYVSHKEVYVQFTCTGYSTVCQTGQIRNGSVRNRLKPSVFGKGYLGEGPYSTSDKSYYVWSNMLSRCYSLYTQENQPTYVGCTVCDEWHNLQTFSQWYIENCPNDEGDYHLDKDILHEGNKHYSPDTCLIVPREQNIIKASAKSFKFLDPVGNIHQVYNLNSFSREKGLTASAMYRVHSEHHEQHKGWRKAYA